jgi:hypothetical protein
MESFQGSPGRPWYGSIKKLKQNDVKSAQQRDK